MNLHISNVGLIPAESNFFYSREAVEPRLLNLRFACQGQRMGSTDKKAFFDNSKFVKCVC